MSRIGKQEVTVPSGVTVTVLPDRVSVKGAKAELSQAILPHVSVKLDGQTLTVAKDESEEADALSGTMIAHIKNMIKGVTEGFKVGLILEGIGYRVEVKGKEAVLALGFSHLVHVPLPEGISMTTDKNIITITGADKGAVGQFAAKLRALKKPEPYKGKGMRYEGEVIRRKQGKRAVA